MSVLVAHGPADVAQPGKGSKELGKLPDGVHSGEEGPPPLHPVLSLFPYLRSNGSSVSRPKQKTMGFGAGSMQLGKMDAQDALTFSKRENWGLDQHGSWHHAYFLGDVMKIK